MIAVCCLCPHTLITERLLQQVREVPPVKLADEHRLGKRKPLPPPPVVQEQLPAHGSLRVLHQVRPELCGAEQRLCMQNLRQLLIIFVVICTIRYCPVYCIRQCLTACCLQGRQGTPVSQGTPVHGDSINTVVDAVISSNKQLVLKLTASAAEHKQVGFERTCILCSGLLPQVCSAHCIRAPCVACLICISVILSNDCTMPKEASWTSVCFNTQRILVSTRTSFDLFY